MEALRLIMDGRSSKSNNDGHWTMYLFDGSSDILIRSDQ